MTSLARRLLEPPNLLSLVRIPLSVVPWFFPDDRVVFAVILALGGITDGLDGTVARWMAKRRGEEIADAGGMGAWMDPLCDKIFAVVVVGAALYGFKPPLWIVPVLLLRDIAIGLLFVPFRLVLKDKIKDFDFRATRSGKNTTVLQYAAVLAIIFYEPAVIPLTVATGLVGTWATISIARRAWKHHRATAR
jgi:phosphatidylglycerophosphate synthase